MHYRIQEPGAVVLRARSDLRISARSERGREYQFIEDPVRNQFFRLGKAEYAVFAALDGKRTLEEVVARAAGRREVDALTLEQALALAKWLVDAGLATTDSSESTERFQRHVQRRRSERWSRINPWFLRVDLGSPDRWLNRLAPLGAIVFSRAFFVVWLLAAVAALTVVMSDWTAITAHSPLVLGWRGVLHLLIIWCLLKLVHETAHALACRHVGGSVGNVGLAFVLGMPSPFVDVTSVWRQSDRGARILVSLAGVYVETFIASLSILVWASSNDDALRQNALATALIAGVSTLVFNLNPLMRFDGYFALSDWLDVANLAARARQESLKLLRRYVLGLEEPSALRVEGNEARWLAAYGLAAMLWRVFVVAGLLSLALYKFGVAATCCLIVVPSALGFRKAYRTLRTAAGGVRKSFRLRRAVLTWCSSAAVAFAALYFLDPRTMEVPAVVDYEPLGVVRSAAPGFVREVFVADGEQVAAGQPLVRLENEELLVELAQTRLALQQHLTKARMHRQAGTVAKEQSELRQCEAVEVKLAHLSSRYESLTVRAPVSGHVVSRGLAQLPGRWLAEGSEVAAIGNEFSKQIVAALIHCDSEALQEAGGDNTVRLAGSPEKIEVTALHSDPRADYKVIHPALSRENGGEIPVRRRDKSNDETDVEKTLIAEFYEPHFRVTAMIDQTAAQKLYAGRTATLRIRTTWRGAASRYWSHWSRWLQRRASTDAESTAHAAL